MLKPAQLYKDKLKEEIIKSWYEPENIFWNGSEGTYMVDLPDDNHDKHCFVSIDKSDEVIGYISYSVYWSSMSAENFGIISFKKNSIEFAKDLYKVVCDLFEVYHMNRISWSAYADNPAIRGYRNFIKNMAARNVRITDNL